MRVALGDDYIVKNKQAKKGTRMTEMVSCREQLKAHVCLLEGSESPDHPHMRSGTVREEQSLK